MAYLSKLPAGPLMVSAAEIKHLLRSMQATHRHDAAIWVDVIEEAARDFLQEVVTDAIGGADFLDCTLLIDGEIATDHLHHLLEKAGIRFRKNPGMGAGGMIMQFRHNEPRPAPAELDGICQSWMRGQMTALGITEGLYDWMIRGIDAGLVELYVARADRDDAVHADHD